MSSHSVTDAPVGRVRGAGLEVDAQVRRGQFDLHAELVARPGELVAVLGPNGSGKTTLLHAIAGLVPVASGSVVIDDVVVDDGSRRVAPHRRSVGLVFQDPRLFPHLSVLDNVAFAAHHGAGRNGQPRHEERGRRRAARRAAREWLDRLGVSALAPARPAELSGGEAQRVALAQALARSPRVLLLDEPLASVDQASRPALRELLSAELARHEGIHVLVTHDEQDASALASRIIRLG